MNNIHKHLPIIYLLYMQSKRPTITMPPNLQEVKLKFARRRSAKVMGSLADREKEVQEGDEVQGILVTHNFQSKIVAADDLAAYTPLRVGSIHSKLHVPFIGLVSTIRLFLTEMFANVVETSNDMTDTTTEADGSEPVTFELHGGQVSVRHVQNSLFGLIIQLNLVLFLFLPISGSDKMWCRKGCGDCGMGRKPCG